MWLPVTDLLKNLIHPLWRAAPYKNRVVNQNSLMLPHSLMLLKAFKQFSFWIFYVTVRGVALCIIITLQRFSSAQICWTIQPVLLLCKVVVCKSGKVFFGAVCNLVIPPLKSGPLEVNKPSIDQLLLWPHRRNEDFQSRPNIWSSKLLLLYRLFEAEIISNAQRAML